MPRPRDEPDAAPRELMARDGDGSTRLSDLSGAEQDPRAALTNEDPVDRLRRLIADRREETIEVLRGWMDEPQGDAR